MHGRHRKRQINLSNLFGTPTATGADASTSDTASATGTTSADGGLLGGLSSLLNPSPTSSSATTSSAPPSSSSTPPTSSSPPPTSPTDPDSAGTTTVHVVSTSTAGLASASTSPSPSTAADTGASTAQTSKVAAGVVGSLVGVIALGMVVAFFLRRWNRKKRRAARESMAYFPDSYGQASDAAPPVPTKEAAEPKETYVDAVSMPYQFPGAPGYSENATLQRQEPAYRSQMYSPRPADGYTSEAQKVMYEYEGQQGHNQYPHPHEAYGGQM
uniref:receptor protein-tyrosine kinase n=1 Tax=Mycena chlorophos TaxID=658473 RepID=A0ABQ0KXG6_MYCCL|nr:predicted protein [Mycena chlorophos]